MRLANSIPVGGGGLVAKSCLTLCNPVDRHQSPLYMGFPRQEYWSRLPFPSLGDLPDPGIEPTSPALQADSFPSEVARRQPKCLLYGLPWGLSGKAPSLGREDPLEKEVATHSSTLA